ncbi:MAG: hypothetical protein ACYDCM_17560 [Candidatus Acidiferrales bacterium]
MPRVFVADDELSLLAFTGFFLAMRMGAAVDDVFPFLAELSVFLSPSEFANVGAADMSAIATNPIKILLIHSSLRMFLRFLQEIEYRESAGARDAKRVGTVVSTQRLKMGGWRWGSASPVG